LVTEEDEAMSEWDGLPRFSKLSSVLYPDQVSLERRAEMQKIAAREGKQLRGSTLLSHEERKHVSQLGGVAVSSQQQKRK
jgi:hypothetical protein